MKPQPTHGRHPLHLTRVRHGTAQRLRRAFSLLEVIVAVTIVAILAAVVAPNVLKWVGDANTKRAKSDVNQIASQIRLWMVANGRSTPPEDLTELVTGDSPQIEGGPSALNDPWGVPYQMRVPGENAQFEIVTYGADKQPGGEGENADVVSGQK